MLNYQKALTIYFLYYKINNWKNNSSIRINIEYKGRLASYIGWKNGGSFGFGIHTNETASYYIFPLFQNEGLFLFITHWGFFSCYEMVHLEY